MNSIPKNKSEETRLPAVLLVVAASIAIAGVLIFANVRSRRQKAVTIRSTAALTPDGEGPSRSEDRTVIDLSKFFNADRHQNWLGGATALTGLSGLPSGVVTLEDVPFKIDGIVQLCGVGVRADSSKFPKSVEGISVDQSCNKLHFLLGTGWTMPNYSQIAAYVIHYSDGTREEVPVEFGRDVRDWLFSPSDMATTNNAAWYSLTSPNRENCRIYQTAWTNSKPDMRVKSVDFVSYGTKCAPFLLAITAEVGSK